MGRISTQCSPRELMHQAMISQPTDRIPAMPQICHDVAIRIYQSDCSGDWIDGLQRCVEDPKVIYNYVIRLVEEVGCDGLRLFVYPEPMKVVRIGDELIVLDKKTNNRIGRINTMGGGNLLPDKLASPVETLRDAQERLDKMVLEFSDEKMEVLSKARERVPNLFVASKPGNITMDTYITLRGREQAMMDLIDRPEFVSAVMDMQVEIMIQRAEKLLSTGIDAFYISDPSASASLISPKHFEKYCFPAYQKFCRHFHDRGILIYLHICGNSSPILEMMADTGVHAIEPLDPMSGVSIANAKQRVGDRVTLMGGVNTLTLSGGTEQEVRVEAIKKCKEGGPYGYILAAGDMVPPETPLTNLQAMVDVATKSLWNDHY